MTVLEDLHACRPAFGDRSEREPLAACLDEHLPRGRTKWLEVGVGDGVNLAFLMTRLMPGRSFDVVAIDPAPAISTMSLAGAEIRILRTGVEDFRSDDRYECINVRQSCYYFDEPASRLRQLGGLLAPDGILTLTVWTKRCALHRLHRKIAEDTGGGREDLHSDGMVREMDASGFRVRRRILATAPLSLRTVETDDIVAGAVYRLAARSLDLTHSRQSHAERCRSFFSAGSDTQRENEILVFSR